MAPRRKKSKLRWWRARSGQGLHQVGAEGAGKKVKGEEAQQVPGGGGPIGPPEMAGQPSLGRTGREPNKIRDD